MADENLAGAQAAAPTPTGNEVSFHDDGNASVDNDLDNMDYLGSDDEEVVMDGLITDEPEKAKADMTDAVDKQKEVKPEEVKPELTEKDIQYQKIMKMMENPKIIEAIKAVQAAEANPNAQQQQVPQQKAPSDDITFTEEELSNPTNFAKSIINKIQSKIQDIQTAFDKQIEPLRIEYGKMMFEKECNSLVSEFGDDAKPFINKNTREFESLKDKFLANPTLTLRDAFLLVRPTAVNKMVEKGVNSAIERGREQSLRVGGNKTPLTEAPKTGLSAHEAVIQAFRDHGISF